MQENIQSKSLPQNRNKWNQVKKLCLRHFCIVILLRHVLKKRKKTVFQRYGAL